MDTQSYIKMSAMALLALGCLACQCTVLGWHDVRGSGHMIEEHRDVHGVKGVTLATLGTLYIKTGDEESLVIEAEDNLLKYIRTSMQNGRLLIDSTWQIHLWPIRNITYYLTVKELDTINISSSGDVYAEIQDLEAGRFSVKISSSGNLEIGDLHADSLTVHISSSGDMKTGEVYADSVAMKISSSGELNMDDLQAHLLRVDLSSSGDLYIEEGKVERQDIKISSSGIYNSRGLESNEADVNISSSGSATIRVNDRLNARVSSSGDVYYIGDPDVKARTSSSGDIINIGD
jgi:hypothetical protein